MLRSQPTTTPQADPTLPRRRRGDRGLTTLEWLLIVAAVAGLAALAVVLVQNVVDDTAEQISQSSARLTAAEVAAAQITADGKTQIADGDDVNEVNSDGRQKCERLRITYGDALDDATRTPGWQNLATGSPVTGTGCTIPE